MSIDFGLRRIGLAITDTEQILASPLTTVATDTIFGYLKDFLRQNNVQSFVIGFPKNPSNNQATHATIPTLRFACQLYEQFPDCDIYLLEEWFTSRLAKQSIQRSGVKKKKRRQKETIDCVSAAILLNDFLTLRKNKKVAPFTPQDYEHWFS